MRNQFVRFERWFHLQEIRGKFPLSLFADTRYRLRVNGAFVAAGPGRFVTQFPEFDTHELSPFLRPGANRISVEVNFFGASSYQSMPDGKPGFIAWGGFTFAPVVHRITRASGRIAHPDGWINVSWEKQDGEIEADIRAPEGVEVQRVSRQFLLQK